MPDADVLAAAATGFLLVAGVIGAVYAATRTGLGWWAVLPWGRRRRRASAIRRLDVGQTLQRFTSLLGEPDRIVRDELGRRYVFEHRDASVTALVDPDDVVTAFHVVATSRTFHARIMLTPHAGDPLQFDLGRTALADVGEPTATFGFLGANTWDYRELHYLGRPGRYHYYVLGHGMGSPIPSPESYFEALREVAFTVNDSHPYGGGTAVADPRVVVARQETPVTGYAVVDASAVDAWTIL